jgi:uncharacterized membrane protein YhaH (DUF805 family)
MVANLNLLNYQKLSQPEESVMTADQSGSALEEVLFAVIGLALVVVPMGRIYHRAGFSWAWALLMFIPSLGWIVCWVVLGARTWRWRRGH